MKLLRLLFVLCLSLGVGLVPTLPALAAVNDQTSRNDYTGDGTTTVFSYTFEIFTKTDVLVLVNGVTKTVDTDYTVGGLGASGGGTVTMMIAPAAAATVTLLRNQTFSQGSTYVPNQPFPSAQITKDLDKLVMLTQQLREQNTRALSVPEAGTTAHITLPALAARSGNYLGFDANGAPIALAATTSQAVLLTATSTTSLTIGTGSQTFTTQASKNFNAGQFVSAASAANNSNFMHGQITSYSGTTLIVNVTDIGGSGTLADWLISISGSQGATGQNSVSTACQGRLTLTSGLPVTTSDVTGAGTIYFTPFRGNIIGTYSGSVWTANTFTEKSLALTLTSGKPYDVFIVDGTLALEVLVWTNDTTRATALTLQDGIYVKSGDVTRRYLGTIYASGANTTEDSVAKRYVWNTCNRVQRSMKAVDTTDSWNYTTATWRQANAAAGNQLAFVVGLAEDAVSANVLSSVNNSTGGVNVAVGIGLDSTTTNSATVFVGGDTPTSTRRLVALASYRATIAAGRHTLVWLEISQATGTTTWYGDNGSTLLQSGIVGEVSD